MLLQRGLILIGWIPLAHTFSPAAHHQHCEMFQKFMYLRSHNYPASYPTLWFCISEFLLELHTYCFLLIQAVEMFQLRHLYYGTK